MNRSRTPFLVAFAGALLLSAGCSKAAETSTPAATTTTAAATTTTAGSSAGGESTTTAASGSAAGSGKSFIDQMTKADLPATVTTCINDKGSSDATFKSVVESKANPSLEQAKQVVPVILSCMTKDEFAKVVIAGISSPVSAAGMTCLTQLIGGLSTDELAGVSANDPATTDRINPQLVACASA